MPGEAGRDEGLLAQFGTGAVASLRNMLEPGLGGKAPASPFQDCDERNQVACEYGEEWQAKGYRAVIRCCPHVYVGGVGWTFWSPENLKLANTALLTLIQTGVKVCQNLEKLPWTMPV